MTGKNLRGSANPNWRGGRTVTSHGYVLLRMPDHPAADVRGYVYEHRVVMEDMLGRPLLPGERPRHKDGNPANNDPSNLQLVAPLDRDAVTACACGCGTEMTVLDRCGRRRRFISGHNVAGVKRPRKPTFKRAEGERRLRCETTVGLDAEWREQTLEDFGGLCAYGCGRPASQWDHVIPWICGGSFRTPGNAVPVCQPCNAAKGVSEDPWPWIDRGLRSAQAEAMEMVVSLAVSWGQLEVAA